MSWGDFLETVSLAYVHDFRAAAVQASRAAMSRFAGFDSERGDLTQLPFSVCVPALGDAAQYRAHAARINIAALVYGYGAFFGGIAALMAIANLPFPPNLLPLAALVLLGSGWVVMLNGRRVESITLRRYRRRIGAPIPAFSPTRKPVTISIEGPSTIRKMKVVPEDVAQVFADARRSLVLIEGFSHRYLIRAQDVLRAQVKHVVITDVVYLTCAFADQHPLDLALVYNSVGSQLGRLAAMRSPLVKMLERSLGIPIRRKPWARPTPLGSDANCNATSGPAPALPVDPV